MEVEQPAKPHCLIVLGMAGSGKSSFIRRFNASFPNTYCVNLDPAVNKLAFPAKLDIKDTINFKDIMQKHNLGPNGAIMTSLNLFATQFDQVLKILEEKTEHPYIVIDTPGQIEAFTWSASGAIITETLAFSFPTTIIYVIDTTRCTNPNSFMSNMLYACSIYYKTRLPMLIVFNKTDVQPCAFAQNWMQDLDSFMTSLDEIANESYLATMNRSLSLVLDEFYQDLPSAGVSSAVGFGFEALPEILSSTKKEFYEVYLPEMMERRAKAGGMEDFNRDLLEDKQTVNSN